MGLIITPQEKIDSYFESDALSQSQLKKLLKGIDFFVNNSEEEKKLYYEEKGHFIIGSAVDTLLTGEKGEFEKQYYVTQLEKKPSDVEMSMIQKVFDEVSEVCKDELTDLADYAGSVQASIEEHNWQPNWKMETKINKIIEVGSAYFDDLKKGFGKQILTVVEKKLIDDIVFSLRSSPRTAKYFDRNTFSKSTTIDIYYQLPIYFYFKDIYCKALLDLLIVVKDEKGNIISAQPVDLKTMNGSTLKFISNLKSFRYDIQAAWYTEALLTDDSDFVLRGLITKENILKFLFIVESNSFPGQPLVYEIDEEIMKIGRNGKSDLLVKRPGYDYDELVQKGVKGFEDLIKIYEYQNEHDWKEEEVITKNDGVLKIDWNGIKE